METALTAEQLTVELRKAVFARTDAALAAVAREYERGLLTDAELADRVRALVAQQNDRLAHYPI